MHFVLSTLSFFFFGLCFFPSNFVPVARSSYLSLMMHAQLSKETYKVSKETKKRPSTVSKETYYSVKRDLLQCQKRPTVSKETYKVSKETKKRLTSNLPPTCPEAPL
jgi:hypothetical protein